MKKMKTLSSQKNWRQKMKFSFMVMMIYKVYVSHLISLWPCKTIDRFHCHAVKKQIKNYPVEKAKKL